MLELNDEEIIEWEERFIETCYRACKMYHKVITETDLETRQEINTYQLSRIFFRNLRIRLDCYPHRDQSPCQITFYGSRDAGGVLILEFPMELPERKLRTNFYLSYPFDGEIIKIIIKKYKIKTLEDLKEFLKTINDKDIELL